MVIRIFPVKSSEPGISTNIRPTLKTLPARNLATPASNVPGLNTAVATEEPKAIYIPAKTPKINNSNILAPAFFSPISLIALDISKGLKKRLSIFLLSCPIPSRYP
jgi:hypothetical protein